jgi:(1->4)-alpha-D-glucan 1-alpha-D-glucosylmutase
MTPDHLVSESYEDAFGTTRAVPAGTRSAFIAALSAAQTDAIAESTRVIREGEALTIDVTLPSESWEERALWTARDERGTVRAGTLPMRDAPVVRYVIRDGATYDTRRLTLPFAATVGQYRITLDVGTYGHAGIDAIVAPARCYLPSGDAYVWGLAVQVYTLRSKRNWGIGDFTDLATICVIASDAGASLVGINPLHASHRTDPEAASPYGPASRRFLNWLAIDVEAVPEAKAPAVARYIASIGDDLMALRARAFVDYTGVAAAKDAALRLCYAALDGERAAAFAEFVRAGGTPLRRFAIYEALVARYGRVADHWPASMLNPEHPDVAVFATEERVEVGYGMYLQWCAAEQFEAVSAIAQRHGIAIYRDLAVGVETNSADVWGATEYVTIATVGAPPDILNRQGQDWGLPPISPTAIARNAYAGFAGLLADNMRNAGALRIDHAMSLMRLFWIPRGAFPADGAYVKYPFEALLGILARESIRARCVVIGEDLGTVPPGFRDAMAASNVLSYRILLFERESDGAFLPPDAYPALALATTGTHDLPPLAGWLAGADIDERRALGFLDTGGANAERASREVDIAQLCAALQDEHDLGSERDTESIVIAAYRYLARSNARIVMVQIDDVLGETSSVNIPGTYLEYPNWRRKLREDIDTIAGSRRLERFASMLREMRPRL